MPSNANPSVHILAKGAESHNREKTANRLYKLTTERDMLRNKCSYTQDKTTIKACDALCEVIERGQPSANKNGVWHIEHSAEGELLSKTYFIMKGGLQKDQPAVLNFCPFCGEKFDTPGV